MTTLFHCHVEGEEGAFFCVAPVQNCERNLPHSQLRGSQKTRGCLALGSSQQRLDKDLDFHNTADSRVLQAGLLTQVISLILSLWGFFNPIIQMKRLRSRERNHSQRCPTSK